MDPILAAMRVDATPELYRRNVFRLTGVPTDADRRTVRDRRQKILRLLDVGAELGTELGHDPDETTDAPLIARAFDVILGDPRRRLVDELFWLWDTATADCRCPATLHRDHDEAVRAHSAALAQEARHAELTPDERSALAAVWETAAKQWGAQLRRVAFWDHVRHRIDVLDDKQLDESAVGLLRDEMPIALVRPAIALAATPGGRTSALRTIALGWPAPRPTVLDLLEEAAAPLYESVDTAVQEAREIRRDGEAREAAKHLRRSALPPLERLTSLVPPDEHRRTSSVRDDVAVVFNNCAMDLIGVRGARSAKPVRNWLALADRLATDPQIRTTVTGNHEYVDRVVAAEHADNDLAAALERELRGGVRRPPARGRGRFSNRTVAALILLALFICWVVWLANYGDGS